MLMTSIVASERRSRFSCQVRYMLGLWNRIAFLYNFRADFCGPLPHHERLEALAFEVVGVAQFGG